MGEIKNSLEEQIKDIAKKFLEKSLEKEIQVVSHFDTDGISSAAIMVQALKKLDKKFNLKIVKSLEEQTIYDLKKSKITFFLDLASGSLKHIEESNLKEVFIIDHHELISKVPDKVEIINPQLHSKEKLSSSSLTYLFCKELDEGNKEFAKLAVLGMVGDIMEKEIDKFNSHIIEDGNVKRKRGLLIYPSTRPLNRTLEFSSSPYIPGITGNTQGVIELLRETGLSPKDSKYKSIIDLNKEEMEKLVTSIMLKNPQCRHDELIGDIFLIKMFNKLEDAREISAIVNACSRFGDTNTSLQFLMEIPSSKKMAEAIHIKYKQLLISGLDLISKIEKIKGNGFIIINAKNKIKDTMIGTIASILQNSGIYEQGTIIIIMACYDDKIKISARTVGRIGRNVRELLSNAIEKVGGEVGGHEFAAGCIISKEKENQFIEVLKKNLEIELVRV